jgi:hypothetical protein
VYGVHARQHARLVGGPAHHVAGQRVAAVHIGRPAPEGPWELIEQNN